ncbi:MAG: methionyl-tRNA formyltransferase [Desulfobacterales bacterium]|nr:MAG: methionyl-tRNA formyltransferase [Desulfobacterales bacterium]
MGTPDFAVPSLKALHASDHRVVLVVTQPDRPRGRGRQVFPPPLKTTALSLGYDVIQPDSLRSEALAADLTGLRPDIIVVIAFGHILPDEILSLPRLGAINVHASLLPKYRGPAPIPWAIINGERETGVTTILMDAGLDTGAILLTSKTEISSEDTAASLHDRLALLSARLLIETLAALEANDIQPEAQDHSQATYAPLLTKRDGQIDWGKPAFVLERFVRGMSPWPGAYTFHGVKRLKIFKTKPLALETPAPPGTVIKGFADELRVATGQGTLSILEIQGASGNRLLIKDFLRGYKIPPGTRLG